MTRIFDAMKKAQSRGITPGAHPTAAPAYPAAPAPVSLVRPAPAPAPPPPAALPRLDVVSASVLPEDIAREMNTLRIGLESALEERVQRSIMFMGSQGGEGTTTIAAQFALLLAADPRVRVVLVDAHVRRPALGERFGLGGRDVRRGTDATDIQRPLSVVPVTDDTVAEGWLGPARARDLLAHLARDYDWVVLDGPPVLESPESLELATLADGVVVVLQSGHSKRPVVARAVELLRKSGARILGSVLNRRRMEIPGFIYRRI
jgi:Mrp family chromosome partitioning ATPase